MKGINQAFLWKILLVLSIFFLSFAGYSQWNRYQDDQKYQALVEVKKSQELVAETGEPPLITAEITADDSDVAGNRFEFQYRENPAKEWLDINPDFMGWITVENTNINYPYVRSMNNEDYLDRDFYRQKSASGAIFIDYRNLGNFNDNHTILYGHNMKSKTMFHQLNNYEEKGFFEENTVIEISGLYNSKTFQVFSVYEVSANDYAFQLNFQDQEAYLHYLEFIASLSLHPATMEVDPNQKLLTLATCSYGVDNGRFVVHALEM